MGVSNLPRKRTTCGCATLSMMSHSLSTFRSSSGFSWKSREETILTATLCPVSLCTPSLTLTVAPTRSDREMQRGREGGREMQRGSEAGSEAGREAGRDRERDARSPCLWRQRRWSGRARRRTSSHQPVRSSSHPSVSVAASMRGCVSMRGCAAVRLLRCWQLLRTEPGQGCPGWPRVFFRNSCATGLAQATGPQFCADEPVENEFVPQRAVFEYMYRLTHGAKIDPAITLWLCLLAAGRRPPGSRQPSPPPVRADYGSEGIPVLETSAT